VSDDPTPDSAGSDSAEHAAPLPRHLDPRRSAGGRHLASGPLPPELDPRGGRSGRHGRRSPRRYRRRGGPLSVTGKVIAAVLSVTIFITSGVMWATTGRNLHPQQINALPSDDGLPAGGAKHDKDGKSQNILVVGNDSRAGLTQSQLEQVGTDATPGLDTDTILLVHLPADGSKATVISFPRDSYVDIPGYKKNKINSAYADGACLPPGQPERDCSSHLTAQERGDGAQVLIRTVSELTQLHIDHYVEVSLLGFYTISNALGGVNVCLARRWYDPVYEKGIDVPAGNVTLKGKLALAFVRERHTLPNGDLDRIRRQQAFIGALVRKVLSAGTLLNPVKLNNLIKAVSNSLTLDRGLKPFDLVDQMRGVAAGNVTFSTIPTGAPGKTSDGKDVLLIDPAKVQSYVDTVIGQADPAPAKPSSSASAHPSSTVPHSAVHVEVHNGTLTQNLADTTGTALKKNGFTVTGTGNADRQDYTRTQIQYGPSQAAAARVLGSVVPGAKLTPDASLGNTLTLVLGSDFTAVRSVPTHTAAPTHPASPPAASGSTSKVTSRSASSTSCVN
jgi:LCP family protein required for cell wall assembly